MDKSPILWNVRPTIAAFPPEFKQASQVRQDDLELVAIKPQLVAQTASQGLKKMLINRSMHAFLTSALDAAFYPDYNQEWFESKLAQDGFFLLSIDAFADPLRRYDARRRLLCYLWLLTVPLCSRGDAYAVWYRLKFIGQEIDDAWARAKGHELAKWPSQVSCERLTAFRRDVLRLLCRESSPSRLKGSLIKNYDAFRLKTGRSVAGIATSREDMSADDLVRQLRQMERESVIAGRFVGTAPVVYIADDVK